MKPFYAFSAKTIEGNHFSFEQLQGKVVLIVNTASRCGLTPQYEGLQKLYEQYHESGFEILAFPSNDFLFQEPGDAQQIQNFCTSLYGVSFPLFEKVKVRGKQAHPLYTYLVKGGGDGRFKGFIKWNFTKFLVDQNGQLVARFSPSTQPKDIEKKIQELLAK